MTKQECAVVEAYTGVCMLKGEDRRISHEYLKHLFGRPVYTHEIPKLSEEIKKRAKEDFICICRNAVDLDDLCADMEQFLDEEDGDKNESDDDAEFVSIIEAFIDFLNAEKSGGDE